MFPCFVFGYFVGKKGWITLMKTHLKQVTILSLILFVIMFLLYNTDCYVYVTGSYLFGTANPIRQLGIDLFRIVIGVIGSILVISILMFIYSENRDDNVTKLLCFFGKNTMGIYCFQNYFWIVYPIIISYVIFPIFVNRLVVFVVCTALCSLLTTVVKKSHVMNFIFLGGR